MELSWGARNLIYYAVKLNFRIPFMTGIFKAFFANQLVEKTGKSNN